MKMRTVGRTWTPTHMLPVRMRHQPSLKWVSAEDLEVFLKGKEIDLADHQGKPCVLLEEKPSALT
jgi:hypothetical protein